MKFNRITRYYYLRFIRLRGEPHELALGMALGVFSGMMPIIPFHMALGVALALIFKGSKITAMLGTWISNPLSWYFLYYLNYKIGALVLGLSNDNNIVESLMGSFRNGEEGMALILNIVHASSTIIGAFAIGGLIMGAIAFTPAYFISLRLFSFIKTWREEIRERKSRETGNQ